MEFLALVAFVFWASWQIDKWEREVKEAEQNRRKVCAHRSLFRD